MSVKQSLQAGQGWWPGWLDGTPVVADPNRINSVKRLSHPAAENRGQKLGQVLQERT
jgi:hypothetical protein